MAGRLIPDFFPKIFGPTRISRSTPTLWRSLRRLARNRRGRTPEQVADGFIKIAVENMANAIKKISVQRGYDVTRYALNCFGGAGGQHACLVADSLGIKTVLIHPLSGLFSAYGMGLADIRATRPAGGRGKFGERRKRRSTNSARNSARRPQPKSKSRASRVRQSLSSFARTSATPAPIRRWKCPQARSTK